jgi:DNA processing protein
MNPLSNSAFGGRGLVPGQRAHELIATVALIRSAVVPGAQLGSLIDEAGSAVRLAKLSETDRLFVPPHASHAFVGAVSAGDLELAAHDVARWEAEEFDIRSVLDIAYPIELHDIYNKPPLLFVRGYWPAISIAPSVAVVGTRKPSDEGIERARRLATELATAGYTTLSGLAAGIDTAAHRAALEAGGRTAAVVGTGLNHVYPAENASLATEIVANGGALISQFFPDQGPARWSFPMRNVVMSGLSLATIVVEAGMTSGARMQARVALQHGRTVFLLQSLVRAHEWARKLVTEGAYGTHAIEITGAQDVIQRLATHSSPEQRLAVA